jgi:4-cresol dehydrogenase (hydroxylating)
MIEEFIAELKISLTDPDQQIIQDKKILKFASENLNNIERTILAILFPRSTHEVKIIVLAAAKNRVHLYPVSRGQNWGLGCKSPILNNSVLVSLEQMNQILSFDKDGASLRVESGVSLKQACDFVHANSDDLYLPATGAPPQSSLVGNLLERGDAIGPGGDRFISSCSYTVVLGTGEVCKTGFARHGNTQLKDLAKWGIGPSLDGLFCQSNFGIVTEVTFFLQRRPKGFQSFVGYIKDEKQLELALPRFRLLQEMGILKPNGFAIWNHYKMLATEGRYGDFMGSFSGPISLEKMGQIKSAWGKNQWIFTGALYSPTVNIGRAERLAVKEFLRDTVKRIIFVTHHRAKIIKYSSRWLSKITNIDVNEALNALFFKSVYLGHPTTKSSKSLYWRKDRQLPLSNASINPIEDACGMNWLCIAIPFDAKIIRSALNEIQKIMLNSGFEPQIAFVAPTPHYLCVFPTMAYDRSLPGEAQKSLECHDAVMTALKSRGLLPYRLGLQSMKDYPQMNIADSNLYWSLKNIFDPHNIIAPGRYEPKVSS